MNLAFRFFLFELQQCYDCEYELRSVRLSVCPAPKPCEIQSMLLLTTHIGSRICRIDSTTLNDLQQTWRVFCGIFCDFCRLSAHHAEYSGDRHTQSVSRMYTHQIYFQTIYKVHHQAINVSTQLVKQAWTSGDIAIWELASHWSLDSGVLLYPCYKIWLASASKIRERKTLIP